MFGAQLVAHEARFGAARFAGAYAAAATPAAYVGARLAVRSNPERLTRVYGAVLVLLASGLLLVSE